VETLEWLADRVEGNLLAAKQEVEKLALLLPPGEITLAAIRDSRDRRLALRARRAARRDPRGDARASRARGVARGRRRAAAAAAVDARRGAARDDGARRRPAAARFLPPERMRALQQTAQRHDARPSTASCLRPTGSTA
jgi:DNA polymerase-3 subunit delta